MGPKVSVVVPSYQQARYIERTVESVLQQDGVDFELVVADHSSTDGTWETLQRFADDPRVRLLRTPRGGGAAANWTAVTAAATGEHLKLLPGDDTLEPGSLRRQAALLDASPDTVLVAGRRRIIDANGRGLGRPRGLRGLSSQMSGDEAIRAAVRSGTNPFGEPGAVLMRRDALIASGGWHQDWSYAIDVATYFRVLGRGAFACDTGVVSTFRVSAEQWSVALADSQSEEMTRLFIETAEKCTAVSVQDVRLGARRSRILAQQRRLLYLVLKGRMG